MTARGAPEHHRGPLEHHRGPPAAPPRKPVAGQLWSHQETVALIEAYQEKWYGLKRGQLKAQQWEEVASAVADRCGLDETPKTGTQCRHKVEKLRKRYRAERLRPSPSPSPSPWPYFDYMERMERGPLPISVRLPFSAAVPPRGAGSDGINDEDDDDEDDEEEEEEEEEEERAGSNTRSINGILQQGNWGFSRASRNSQRGFKIEDEEDDDDDEDDDMEKGNRRGGVLSELAAVVRRFGEGMVRMEKRRMEMMKEVERDWLEMEAKRAEMVIESQRALVETIADSLSSFKKAKKSHDDV